MSTPPAFTAHELSALAEQGMPLTEAEEATVRDARGQPAQPVTDINALIAEMRAGLEGVTPGFPDWIWLLGDRTVYTRDPNDGCRIEAIVRSASVGENIEALAHIARCSPANIAALLDEIERLRAALEAVAPAIRAAAMEEAAKTDAARDVLAERQRQTSVEHWTPHHDDNHDRMELSRAARCYVLKAIRSEIDDTSYNPHLASDEQYQEPYPRWEPPPEWPWESTAWKPKGTRADLVRAGALILAEIERLDRAAAIRAAKEVK